MSVQKTRISRTSAVCRYYWNEAALARLTRPPADECGAGGTTRRQLRAAALCNPFLCAALPTGAPTPHLASMPSAGADPVSYTHLTLPTKA